MYLAVFIGILFVKSTPLVHMPTPQKHKFYGCSHRESCKMKVGPLPPYPPPPFPPHPPTEKKWCSIEKAVSMLRLCSFLALYMCKSCINFHLQDCTIKNQINETIFYYVERPYINGLACTRYAWSTVGYPTLFISQDMTKCDCKYSINEREYQENQTSGVMINGTGSYFSLAIVFTGLIEFQVDTKKAPSYTAFNVTKACEDQYDAMDISNDTLEWSLVGGDTLVGNDVDNTSRFSLAIKVSCYSKPSVDIA